MRTLLVIAAVALATASSAVEIDVGSDEAAPLLGFGWSGFAERDGDRSFMWIRRLEADVWVTLDSAGPAEFEFSAVPFYSRKDQQVVGLYINNRFVTQWTCPHRYEWTFETYRADVPEGVLKEGKNRITLRMGFVPDRAHRALAVDRIRLVPK